MQFIVEEEFIASFVQLMSGLDSGDPLYEEMVSRTDAALNIKLLSAYRVQQLAPGNESWDNWHNYCTNTFNQKVAFVWNHILTGTALPMWFLANETNQKLMENFRAVYWSPLHFDAKMIVKGGGWRVREMSLSLRQFSVLHNWYKVLDREFVAPLARSPPEYWYLFQLTKCEELSPPTFEIVGGPPCYAPVVLPQPYVEVINFDQEWALYLKKTAVEQFSSRMGHGNEDWFTFKIDVKHFSLTNDVFDNARRYWSWLFNVSATTPFSQAVHYAIKYSEDHFFTQVVVETLVGEEDVLESTNTGELAVATCELQIHVEDYESNSEVVSESNQVIPVQGCACDACDSHTMLGYTHLTHDPLWNRALEGFPLVVPKSNVTIEDLVNDGCTVVTRSGGLEDWLVVTDESNILVDDKMVVASQRLATQYFKIESFVSKHVFASFYNKSKRGSSKKMRLVGTPFYSKFKKFALPSTFNKFLWLYHNFNYIDDDGGDIQVGVRAIEGLNALEFSAAPYGSLTVLLECGVVHTHYYSRFCAEASKPNGYDVANGGTGAINIVEDGVANDIVSIVTMMLAKDKRVKLPKRVGLLIVDIPLHRNSLKMYKMKSLGAANKSREFAEMVDDVPMAMTEAAIDLIRVVGVLVGLTVGGGGALVLKLIEPWRKDLVDEVYFGLVAKFARVEIAITPGSREISKEVYFHFMGYGEPCEVSRSQFFAQVCDANNLSLAKVTLGLVNIAKEFGHLYSNKRRVGCRRYQKLLSYAPDVDYVYVRREINHNILNRVRYEA